MTKGLERACKRKNKLYKIFLTNGTKENEDKYKKYRNRLTTILRYEKKSYYEKLLQKSQNNIKPTWSVLNKIIKNQNNICFPTCIVKEGNVAIKNIESIVNEFNDYFVNVGPNLAKEISVPGRHDDKFLNFTSYKCNSMFLGGVCESDIIDVVSKFKSKKSMDCDGLDMSLVKEVLHSILQPLTYICNKSFQTGIFPDKMKIAKVIPLYKNGDKQVVSNYRPVSLLPTFSKILEKLFENRLNSFLEKYDLLNDHQYGFRRNRSTSLAVMEFIENIATIVDKKQIGIGVFIDLRKAFDTIDHSLLLQKCERFGLRGVVQLWLNSYLERRFQYVSINNMKSKLRQVTCGVPQGSVLGPKLFLLYINDICTASDILKYVMFADDTNLFCSGDNIKELLKTVEIELMKLNRWFVFNKLSLNESKTKFMLFGGIKNNIEVKLNLNNVEIERVNETKFLGVIIDDKLCWKSHIDHVKRKLSKSISILYKTRDLLHKSCLYLLYTSLCLPYRSYCVEIWGKTYKTYLDSIFKLRKRAIRIINKAGYRESTNHFL
uniref:Reverse transcriptase domain-containing protein n=1 Tax=Nothobranchius furzeri TaxID=105023 RepID=A0A8C6VZ07_NOTFU